MSMSRTGFLIKLNFRNLLTRDSTSPAVTYKTVGCDMVPFGCWDLPSSSIVGTFANDATSADTSLKIGHWRIDSTVKFEAKYIASEEGGLSRSLRAAWLVSAVEPVVISGGVVMGHPFWGL